ncbi:hypothetical protein QQS45_13760 [Alteriqipengyuania flavescens]|uniref:hypothetical protein n=1 Tax=Alteriqipengyuania flavescens TaxID=3053610 RepID=UPI0025B41C1C|nr:hypothetical protein [Alteriqipengyuania flavescens]WJY18647.1 hypothetical protein QQW98_13755 [Alteriqipengyuania flavescens]WJY24587.1 hypothetical protein QQS45_13760 [Alteriqipengyuania flavescens]
MALSNRLSDHRWATAAFILVCAAGYLARQAIGNVYSGAQATQLIEALSRAGLYLGSAIVTASITTLALMLTLIGMIRRMEKEFDAATYRSIDLIAKLATASLMIGLIVLLAFTLPVGEFEEMPQGWFIRLYDGLFAACVVMVGLVAATVAVLYNTVRRVIGIITPGDDV